MRVPATGQIPETSISSGWRLAVLQHSVGAVRLESSDSNRGALARQNLSATDHVVGLFRPSAESGLFLSCGRGPFDRSSRFSWTTSLLGRNGCLLPSQEATAGRVLFRSGSSNGMCIGDQRRGAVALETSARPGVRWFDGIDARYCGKPTGLTPATRSAVKCGSNDFCISRMMLS